MWDTIETSLRPISHDMPCVHCGHALHTYLACGEVCDCRPQTLPGFAI